MAEDVPPGLAMTEYIVVTTDEDGRLTDDSTLTYRDRTHLIPTRVSLGDGRLTTAGATRIGHAAARAGVRLAENFHEQIANGPGRIHIPVLPVRPVETYPADVLEAVVAELHLVRDEMQRCAVTIGDIEARIDMLRDNHTARP